MSDSKQQLREWIDLVEAGKFRKPEIFFHGTSSKFLSSILKNGIVPGPSEKVWADDPNLHKSALSRASLSGSYWTKNLMTATGSAGNAKRKFGGEELIVIAQIAVQSAFADEDAINFAIFESLRATVKKLHPGIIPDLTMALGHDLYDDPVTAQKAQDIFAEFLHKNLGGSPKQTQDRALCDRFLDLLVRRSIEYEKLSGMNMSHWVTNLPEPTPIAELEQEILKVREQLTRSYRKSVFDTDSFSRNLRLVLPVKFSGSNRILNIVELPPWKFTKDSDGLSKIVKQPLPLYYGSEPLPAEFITQYQERIGDFPGVKKMDSQNQE